ncbi:MAG: LexA family transcriptional regulator [Saprospiraceae bacterium]|nr:LexA family transcriptional regulator [Saprospiraceae bacterium]
MSNIRYARNEIDMLSENLKYLRKKHSLSQQQLSDVLSIPRSTLGDYERGHTEPNLATLIQLSEHFGITLDALIKETLSHETMEIARTKDFKVLAISVDRMERENIELVDAKAAAGYLHSFQDPDYIKELPKLYFPNVPQGTYRAFEIDGDSMVPMMPGSVVICSYIERMEEVKNDRTYVIATHLDGLVYKRVLKNPDGESITAVSDNPSYAPFKIPFRDIAEMWQYYAHLSFTDSKTALDEAVDTKLDSIQETVTYIKERLNG